MPDPRPVVLFDFDGTIADSLAVVVPAYNEVATEMGLPALGPGDVEALRRMGPREALRAHAVPVWRVPRLVARVRERLRDRMDGVVPFPGIDPAIRALREAGCRCGILTSNARENVDAFLSRHGMTHFEVISCGASLFGKGALLRRLVQRTGAHVEHVVYVGDEVRDVAAAASAGTRSIAVTWGYAHRDTLVAQRPGALVDAPGEIVAAVLGP